jgi:hypothetical protein
MQFQSGHNSPGPGRPKGSVSGRARALQLLDSILAEEDNLALLREALQDNFRANPVRFFRQIIMPLLPKDVVLKMAEPGEVKWVSLLDSFPQAGDTQQVADKNQI